MKKKEATNKQTKQNKRQKNKIKLKKEKEINEPYNTTTAKAVKNEAYHSCTTH